MSQINYRKATNQELRTIRFDDPLATQCDKAYAEAEMNRRKRKYLSGIPDKRAGARR